MISQLSTIEIQPESVHKYSIIWLHGLGADGHDFAGIVPQLNLNEAQAIHFIFPNAPIQPVTINGGMKMRAWYDILEKLPSRRVDIAGIYESSTLIDKLIQQEIDKGIASENILLAGFSQGGAIALHAGLKYPHKLAGIIALSTYLPTLEQLEKKRSSTNNATPILMAHGIIDPVVAIESGKAAYVALKEMGYDIVWHDYIMEHAVCMEEIEHLSCFINAVFK